MILHGNVLELELCYSGLCPSSVSSDFQHRAFILSVSLSMCSTRMHVYLFIFFKGYLLLKPQCWPSGSLLSAQIGCREELKAERDTGCSRCLLSQFISPQRPLLSPSLSPSLHLSLFISSSSLQITLSVIGSSGGNPPTPFPSSSNWFATQPESRKKRQTSSSIPPSCLLLAFSRLWFLHCIPRVSPFSLIFFQSSLLHFTYVDHTATKASKLVVVVLFFTLHSAALFYWSSTNGYFNEHNASKETVKSSAAMWKAPAENHHTNLLLPSASQSLLVSLSSLFSCLAADLQFLVQFPCSHSVIFRPQLAAIFHEEALKTHYLLCTKLQTAAGSTQWSV